VTKKEVRGRGFGSKGKKLPNRPQEGGEIAPRNKDSVPEIRKKKRG